jgi:pyruvate dehydrogenase E2 component (dihydrolipoamide acetyltransferase)
MAISVVMPALELTQETGKLVAWRKEEGEPVAKGEVLLEVETDKAVVEIEAAADGILAGVKAVAGDIIPVGKTIAWIISPGETPPQEDAPPDSAKTAATARKQPVQSAPAAAESAYRGAKISPKARRLAREHNIDIARVRATGPEGEILASDILALAEFGSNEGPSSGELKSLSSVARLMAERTTQSWTTVPHFFVVREIDAGPLIQALEKARASANKTASVRVTYTDFLVALIARVLLKHPRINSSWAGTGIRPNKDVNIALAMAVDDGVVTGIIQNADRLELSQIAVQRQGLAERAKVGQLRQADIAGGTFTISNLGMYQVDAFSAIIVPPQAAILAVGSICDRVVPVAGQPTIRPILAFTLSCDHRVIDGARAAQFLADLADAVRDPAKHVR